MKFLASLILLLLLFLVSTPAFAAHQHPEKYYQEAWCNEHHGVMEFVLDDLTRIDCLTATHAIEVEFAPKWAESVGQSLHYSLKTGKKAGIVLVLEDQGDSRFLERLKPLAEKYGIDLWIISP
jgi:hypothetical protein